MKWLKFQSIKANMNVISEPLAGTMSLETNILMSRSSRLVRCWFPTDSLCNLSRMEATTSLNFGLRKGRGGLLRSNHKCLCFGSKKMKNIFWEPFQLRSKCPGTGLLKSTTSKLVPSASGEHKKQGSIPDFPPRMNTLQSEGWCQKTNQTGSTRRQET